MRRRAGGDAGPRPAKGGDSTRYQMRQRMVAIGVEIAPGQDDALLLAITVCRDMMTHNG